VVLLFVDGLRVVGAICIAIAVPWIAITAVRDLRSDRRRQQPRHSAATESPGQSLERLERLRSSGAIDDGEYERQRRRMEGG
jgi:hypothetical protein